MKQIPFKVLKQVNGQEATIYLYGYIGQNYEWWPEKREETITDVEFLKALQHFEKEGVETVHVRINSPGGSTLHMDGIISLMQSSKMDVHTWVDGMAASAAADIFLAAKKDNRHMARNAKLMFHEAVQCACGNAKKLRTVADTLDKFTEGSVAQMAADTGMSEDEVMEKFYDGEDHWVTAKEAVEMGFIEKVEDFEAEELPDDIEKMSHEELRKLFEMDSGNEAQQMNFFKRMFPGFFKTKTRTAENTLEMNLEDLKKDFGTEKLPEDEVVKFLEEKGFEVTKKKEEPPAAPSDAGDDIAKIVKTAVESATKELKTEITGLKTEIEKFGDSAGSKGPGGTSVPADPKSGAEGGAEKTLEAELVKMNEEEFVSAARF